MNLQTEDNKIIDLIVDIRKDIDELREHYKKRIVIVEQLMRDFQIFKLKFDDIKKDVDELKSQVKAIKWGLDKT